MMDNIIMEHKEITGTKISLLICFAENLTYGELCHLKHGLNPRHIGN